MRSGRERLIALGGGVTGELQDTWEGIQRRLRRRTRGCACFVCSLPRKCARCAGSGGKLGAVVCVCQPVYVCVFNGVIRVGRRGVEDLLVSIVPVTFGLL